MTQRERFLTIAVAVVLGIFFAQYVINGMLVSLHEKQTAVDAARSTSSDMDKRITDGKIAARALEELAKRSLPRDEQRLVSQYRDWLTSLGRSVEMASIEVAVPDRPMHTTPAYNAYKFSLSGQCRLDRMLELLGKFYDYNYLHRISNASFQWIDKRHVQVNIDSIALALSNASPTQAAPTGSSGRLDQPIERYVEVILGRNPFFPQNNPPQLRVSGQLTIERGKRWEFPLAAEARDPEGDPVRVELVSTEIPAGLRLRGGTIEWEPQENGRYEIVVRAADEAWPSKAIEQRLVLQVVDPKVEPQPEPEPEPPKFDPARQTYVSAMLGGRNGPEVWIRSRVEGKTLKLRVGDEFEVGTIRAKVVDINLRENFIELESDSLRWTVDMDTPLATAFERAKVD
ncbi:MAG: hypothetical protein KatS3mg111_0171 [Pirellulaceae bacterium]|nr:MAG: hypothetical protein KatS3mg111_0171 [Pirellulaceae bacterium]